MIYNEKHNRWISKDGLVYRYSKTEDKLVLCSFCGSDKGYMRLRTSYKPTYFVHRLIWEAFNGEIPEGMQIDHINNDRTDNRLENLQLVTCSENNRLKYERGYAGHNNNRKDKFSTRSEFGERFVACYGQRNIRKDEDSLYQREYTYWKKHGYLKGESDAK